MIWAGSGFMQDYSCKGAFACLWGPLELFLSSWTTFPWPWPELRKRWISIRSLHGIKERSGALESGTVGTLLTERIHQELIHGKSVHRFCFAKWQFGFPCIRSPGKSTFGKGSCLLEKFSG